MEDVELLEVGGAPEFRDVWGHLFCGGSQTAAEPPAATQLRPNRRDRPENTPPAGNDPPQRSWATSSTATR
jgi:hypothetical protein